MKKILRSSWVLKAALLLGLGVNGCSPKPTPQNTTPMDQAKSTRDKTGENNMAVTDAASEQNSIQSAIEKMLESEKKAAFSPIPKGCELRSAQVHGNVLTLDFSSEFNTLADAGDTTESEAQKKILASIRPFTGVEKLRVTVEGKPFNSQNTDWNTPFPVRLSDSAESGVGSKSGRSMETSR